MTFLTFFQNISVNNLASVRFIGKNHVGAFHLDYLERRDLAIREVGLLVRAINIESVAGARSRITVFWKFQKILP